MKRTIVFATGNENKLREIRQMMGDAMMVLGLKDIGCLEELPETSHTLEGNALQKARYVAKNYQLACFSDDTGLEVEVLNGEPGVYSARYAGPACSPEDNMNKLFHAMEGKSNRKAQFRTVVAWVDGQEERCFEGSVTGIILTEKRGEKGFGYDPIFMPDGYQKSFAEMTAEEKNAISHRRRALNAFISYKLQMIS